MLRRIPAALRFVERAAEAVSLGALAFVVGLTVVDVVGRYFLNAPLNGATELTEFGIALTVFSALPAVTWNRGHIAVDLLDRVTPPHWRGRMATAFDAVFAVCLAALGARIWELGSRSARRAEVTEYLEIPLSWIQHYISAICLLVAAGLALRIVFHLGGAPGAATGRQV